MTIQYCLHVIRISRTWRGCVVFEASTQLTSPLSTSTNASIRENPSNCRVFAMSSICFLHFSRASLLHSQHNELQGRWCGVKNMAKRHKDTGHVIVTDYALNQTKYMKPDFSFLQVRCTMEEEIKSTKRCKHTDNILKYYGNQTR